MKKKMANCTYVEFSMRERISLQCFSDYHGESARDCTKMDAFHQHYYKINEILMTCIGQWPYQRKFERRAFLFALMFFCTCQIAPQIMAMIINIDDPVIVLECISPTIFDAICFVKLTNCIVNSDKMLKLMNRIDENWKVWSRDREIDILHEYAETGRKMATLYAVVIYSTGIIFVTQPVLPKIIDVLLYNGTEPGVFPVPVYYHHLDEQKYYFHLIAYTYICISIIIIINIAGDTMFIVHVQHCCGIFAAVGRKLDRLGEKETSREESNDQDFVYLSKCIDRHNEAIEYANLIEATYCGCFFFVVGLNMLIMSVTGLQIITRTNEPQDTIRYIAFIGAQMVHLFIESYVSQMLLDHSSSIREHIHNGKWYNVSLKSQKLLNLVMMRCNMPCKLTAGKICPMSVETFGVVVKTSMSYFTLLRSMQ